MVFWRNSWSSSGGAPERAIALPHFFKRSRPFCSKRYRYTFFFFCARNPQSEVLAKFFEEIGEKCGEILAKFFADFRPSISREMAAKNFTKNPRHFPTVYQIKFFSLLQLWGPQGPISYLQNRYPVRGTRDNAGPGITGSGITCQAQGKPSIMHSKPRILALWSTKKNQKQKIKKMQSAKIWDSPGIWGGYSKVEISMQSAKIWDSPGIWGGYSKVEIPCKAQKSGILQGFWVDIPRLKYPCKAQKSGILQGFGVDIAKRKNLGFSRILGARSTA